jgi:hypothetical protein
LLLPTLNFLGDLYQKKKLMSKTQKPLSFAGEAGAQKFTAKSYLAMISKQESERRARF